MFIYLILELIVGIVAAIMLVKRTKKVEGVTYGKLDKIGIVTNVLLAIFYVITAPLYLFTGLIAGPDGEGILIIFGVILSLIVSSVSMFCSLGLGFSVALRRKGKSVLSCVIQFAGVVAIALMVLLYLIFAGSLLGTLN
jgi:hypothetical protein